MKRIILLVIILWGTLYVNAQQEFSDSTQISLITCSPGMEVYEKFGHTAIRVRDTRNNIDIVFNYGIFDFESKNFIYKFIKGETDYQLGVYNIGNFLASYGQRNSIVWEQSLNLNTEERNRLLKSLMTNYLPEYRIYRYNFAFDNCATRPRDKILESLEGYIKFKNPSEQKTFRHWIGDYVGTDTWLKFGIDIIFGIDADRFASKTESMFLPEVLMTEFDPAQVVVSSNQVKNLISNKKILINKKDIQEPIPFLSIKPLTVSIILLIIGLLITIWDVFRRGHFKLFDSLIYIITGLAGVIVAYLMFMSNHPLVKSNLNILWLNPLNLIVGILIWYKKFGNVFFFYQIFNILFQVVALIAFALSIQIFNAAAFPLIVLLLIRSTTYFAYLKHKIVRRRSVLKEKIQNSNA